MKTLFFLLFSTYLFFSVGPAHAHRKCCAHHQGVCICSCCDGSPFSAKCAPYYPQCDK